MRLGSIGRAMRTRVAIAGGVLVLVCVGGLGLAVRARTTGSSDRNVTASMATRAFAARGVALLPDSALELAPDAPAHAVGRLALISTFAIAV